VTQPNIICPACKSNPDGICSECYTDLLTDMCRLNSFEHLVMMVVCLLNFEFKGVVVEFCWAIERLFEIGDYGPEGYLAELKIDWRKRSD
jgi:hypothetical protein